MIERCEPVNDKGKGQEDVVHTQKPPTWSEGEAVRGWRWDCESKNAGRAPAFQENEKEKQAKRNTQASERASERDVLGLIFLR